MTLSRAKCGMFCVHSSFWQHCVCGIAISGPVLKQEGQYVIPNPLHLKINIHILHTVLYTFHRVLTQRINFIIKSFCIWWSTPLFSWPKCLIHGWYCKEKLDICHSLRINLCLFFCSCLYFRYVLTDHYYFIFDEDSFNRVLAVEQGYKDVVICYVKGLGIKGDPSFFSS